MIEVRSFGLCVTLVISLAGCSPSPNDPSEYDEAGNWKYSKESSYFDDETREQSDEDAGLDVFGQLARENEKENESEEEKGGETYSEYDDRRDSYAGSKGTFSGYGCTVNCGGHEAGYEWAQDKGITDPDQCGGKSWSFVEGCLAYAEENAE